MSQPMLFTPLALRGLTLKNRVIVALAREMLYNPNWAMDAAQKTGADREFLLVPPPYRYWLQRRAATLPEVVPSTHAVPPAKPARAA